MKRLEKLNISGINTKAIAIPESFGNLKNLTEIIFHIQIKNLPTTIEKLTKLETLIFNFPEDGIIPKGLSKLKSLKQLFINSITADSLSIDFQKLTKLEELHFLGDSIKIIPSSITKLNHLKELYIASNRLNTLPQGIEQLAQLEKLNISRIKRLPKNFGQLKRLKHLAITCPSEYIDSLLQVVQQLNTLEHLDLSGCAIIALPTDFFLPNLRYLDLEYNNLKNLPNSIAKFSNLKGINLSSNELDSFPTNILAVKNLEQLNLENNSNIKSIPKELIQLKNLHVLNLSRTGITDLYDIDFEALPNLEELNILSTKIDKGAVNNIRRTLYEKCEVLYN